MDQPGFTASLVAGGVAGVSVDLILFLWIPLKPGCRVPKDLIRLVVFVEYMLVFLLLLSDPFLMLLPFSSPMNM